MMDGVLYVINLMGQHIAGQAEELARRDQRIEMLERQLAATYTPEPATAMTHPDGD